MARAAAFADDDDDINSPLDDFEDDDDDEGDIDEEDVDEEARDFYHEHAKPMTPEDTVEILAAAGGENPSWYRGGRVALPAMGQMVCRVCGCTDERACEGGCFWAARNLCSGCVA